jgi:TRAP-type C4-dicarboxylate transport system permease small subunit
MAEPFHRFCDALYLACVWVAGACIFLMSLFIPWGIYARYVLGTGSQWPEPISILLMVVFSFLGAAVGYRAGGHIAVSMLTERLPVGLQSACRTLVNVLMLAASVFMVMYGAQLCIGTWGQSTPELTWLRVGLTYLPVPVGGAVTAVFVLETILFGSQNHRDAVQFDQEPEVVPAAEVL